MRKDWLWIALASAMLAACSTETEQQTSAPQQPAYNGPVVEISGAEPRYEPINPGTSQDYAVNGKTYKIIKDPANFSQVGLASSYGEEANGNRTATGEAFDPNALTAAHPTLPLPSYVRVTNLANGRMIVVRVNDRGPYTSDRVIDLSRAAADRLNTSNNTRVRIDYIAVAPDGTLSGPGTVGTTIAKQSYALPPRPDISAGTTMGSAVPAAAPIAAPVENQNIRPIDNATLQNTGDIGSPVQSGGFLGAAQPLRSGVLEGSEPPAPAAPSVTATSAPPAIVAAAAASQASGSGNYVVQVGALSDGSRARQLADSLGKRFGVQGAVDSHGNVYRVQLGRFSSRQQAAALQQRLANEANQQSFITVAPKAM